MRDPADASRLNHGREINIVIDAIGRCGGACAGCLMTAGERAEALVWPAATFTAAGRFAARFIEEHLERGTAIQDITMNFGQGDALLLDPDDLRGLIDWVATHGHGRAVAYVNTSAVVRHERLVERVDALIDAGDRRDQGVLANVIVDFARTDQASLVELYAANLDHLAASFGDIDLTLNLGPDTVAAIDPATVIEVLRAGDFRSLTLNLVPTRASALSFAPGWASVVDWIADLVALYRPEVGFEFNIARNFGLLTEATADLSEAGLGEQVAIARQLFETELYFGPDGAIATNQDGIGHVGLSERFGFPRLGSVHDDWEPSAHAFLTPGWDELARRIAAVFARSTACDGCRHRRVCVTGGIANLAQSMRAPLAAGRAACPAGVVPVMDAIDDMLAVARDHHPLHYAPNVGWVNVTATGIRNATRRRPERPARAVDTAVVRGEGGRC